MAGGWAVRARANPLSLGVWHFTLRFVLPRSWVGYPSRRPKGCGMQSPSGPKVYPKFALLPHGMQEWSPRVICGRTRDLRSRDGACRGLARRRQASPLAPTPGAHRTPGLPALPSSRTSSHATLFRSRAVFPADSGRTIRARGGVLGCEGTSESAFSRGLALHPEVRFAWSWVDYPSQRPKGCGLQSPLGPKVYPKSVTSLR